MAIQLGSNSKNEKLMEEALRNEGIKYESQYFVYDRPGDLDPRYVADFLVYTAKKKILLECDGFSWHSSDSDVERDMRRDKWLEAKGFEVLRLIIRLDMKCLLS